MNPLPGNPHYEAAVTNRYAGDMRFTEATLAVAWEARTANIIALFAAPIKDISDFPPEEIEKVFAMGRAIEERLGL